MNTRSNEDIDVYIVKVHTAQLTFGGAWLVGRGLPFELARSRVRDPERAVFPHAVIKLRGLATWVPRNCECNVRNDDCLDGDCGQ